MNIVAWVLRILVAAAFAASGIVKLTDVAAAGGKFAGWGYPVWGVYVVAAIELVGALGLLFARTVIPAAGVLILLMVGAIYTHFAQGDNLVTAGPAVLLVAALAMIVLLRRRDRRAANL